ncbi:MAG TPA: hypothetical protein VFN44_16075 [Solirubrobacteraceae bacterium]|nr:hypothetical protein [Solirubrobacteraceae bacterium]
MPAPRRRQLPKADEIPWAELRRRSTIVFFWLQAGWASLSADEREQVRKLLVKSRGRPNRLSKAEARTLGRLAGRAASAAATARRLTK